MLSLPPEYRIVKSMTLPTGSLPMKLVSLEEAQARSLSATHPARKERRENSLPEIVPVTGTLFHTVIDLPENKRKLSTKSKKWRSIFNLGRSGTESKSKLSRNGSVFVRGQKEMGEKAAIRPAKSMDSLCSLPTEGEDEKTSRFKRPVGAGGFFIPVLRSRATGTGSTYDVSKHDREWDSEDVIGAVGGSNEDKTTLKTPQGKPPPEQMKVFRIGDDPENEQSSPKGRKMFYTSSDGPTKSGFPGSLFPLEASPRHQRKALNISEPFSVSVPLRVSAVISANSTPCRAKERHLLSSLEELPLLEPDSGPKSPSADSNTKSGPKTGPRSPDVAESVKIHEPRRPCLKDLSPDLFEEDDRTLTLKEILLEMSQLPDILPSSAADRKISEHTFVSINELPQVRDLEPKKPEPVTTPVEEKTEMNDLDDVFSNDQEEDESINLLDPVWSNIQQELKIIESEEDLPTHSESSMDPKRTLPPLTPNKPSVESDGANGGLSGLSTDNPISEPVDDDGMRKAATNRNDNLIPSVMDELESRRTLPQEAQDCLKQDQPVIDDQPSPLPTASEDGNLVELVPDEKDKEVSSIKVEGTKTECAKNLQVSVDLARVEDLKEKIGERKLSGSLDNDDDLEVESGNTFELEEFWEVHHWVTSPLHSPKLKNFPGKEKPAIQPKRRGTTGELYKRPEFTRSLSLDSKDTRASQWTMKVAEMKADGGSYIRSRTDQIFNQNMPRETRRCQVISNLPEVPVIVNESDCVLNNIEESPNMEPVVNPSRARDSEHLNSTVPLNSLDNLTNAQDVKTSPDVCNQAQPTGNSVGDDKDVSENPESRPSSINLDAASTSGAIFTFENVTPPDSIVPKSQQIHQSSTVIALYDRSKSLNEKPSSSQSTELDHPTSNHHGTGRRNSAPVSVSAIRASFMIKMCQAKAVPVIPPKIQYTQIPQPLQTINADPEVSDLEKKDVVSEPDLTPKQPFPTLSGHNDNAKSPKTEVKPGEEKENDDPITVDTSQHSSLNFSTDIHHSVPQDAPVLRRKRTSDGEAAGDTPLSSKMERSSGLSRSSFRARSGRPQSLILFSPPFPIMDHPSIDSKILLSPIKSQAQTTQEPTVENQRTPDGVILRNKMTIPKNGQRLETSTSCFYQPQRRSVILDSRSGRQIE
ncbi:rho GTPase-activating protein 31 [Rhinoderma darwinii]|uniref:rho GTPase-activating protein 31 n=1 Tax=Rhinoderma darwinii TaxID=43563 RepID=UPI003F671157